MNEHIKDVITDARNNIKSWFLDYDQEDYNNPYILEKTQNLLTILLCATTIKYKVTEKALQYLDNGDDTTETYNTLNTLKGENNEGMSIEEFVEIQPYRIEYISKEIAELAVNGMLEEVKDS